MSDSPRLRIVPVAPRPVARSAQRTASTPRQPRRTLGPRRAALGTPQGDAGVLSGGRFETASSATDGWPSSTALHLAGFDHAAECAHPHNHTDRSGGCSRVYRLFVRQWEFRPPRPTIRTYRTTTPISQRAAHERRVSPVRGPNMEVQR